jgi:hypothetical protein
MRKLGLLAIALSSLFFVAAAFTYLVDAARYVG